MFGDTLSFCKEDAGAVQGCISSLPPLGSCLLLHLPKASSCHIPCSPDSEALGGPAGFILMASELEYPDRPLGLLAACEMGRARFLSFTPSRRYSNESRESHNA